MRRPKLGGLSKKKEKESRKVMIASKEGGKDGQAGKGTALDYAGHNPTGWK